MVPGLYQKERERAIHFNTSQLNNQQLINVEEASNDVSREQESIEEDFFAPNELIR